MLSRTGFAVGAGARRAFLLILLAAGVQVNSTFGQNTLPQPSGQKGAPNTPPTPGRPGADSDTQQGTPAPGGTVAPGNGQAGRQELQPQPANGSSTPMEFESRGLPYQALTKNGVTVMFATLPPHIGTFSAVQVTVTNGSLVSWTVKPGDFTFIRQDGTTLLAVSADEVVETLLQKASRNDVIKLQLLYEDSIYGLANYRPTNGYEQRREAAMAQFVNRGFKAAAEASAITLVTTRLKPGDSTDGAVFFENRTKEKGIGPGRLIAHTCGETFVFFTYTEMKSR